MPALRTLSAVWFFSLGAFGFFLPFYSLYLQSRGRLSGAQMGAVIALVPAMGLVAPAFWGQLADRSGRRREVLAAVTGGAALGYATLSLQENPLGFALGTALLALFSTSVIPLSLSVSLGLLRDAGARALGRVRVWGSLGFALCVLGFPFALAAWRARTGDDSGLGLIFPGAALFTLTGAALALRLPAGGAVAVRAGRGDWRELLRARSFARTLVFAFACFLCLQGPMQFFPILVHARGGDVDAISRMWALMLAVEVPLMLGFGRMLARFGPRGMIGIGMAAAAARWLVCGFSDDLRWIGAAQLLHGVTVSGVNLGCRSTPTRSCPRDCARLLRVWSQCSASAWPRSSRA